MVSRWFVPRALGLWVALGWLLADQLTKQFAIENLPGKIVPVIDGLLNFRFAINRGVAFSMLADMPHDQLQLGLAGFAAAVAVAMIAWLSSERHVLFQLGVGSIIGGAIGNAIDRIWLGGVVDFIDVVFGTWHFPTFNVADIGINIGVGCILLQTLLEWRQQRREKKNA